MPGWRVEGWRGGGGEDFRLDSNDFGFICADVKLVLNWPNF